MKKTRKYAHLRIVTPSQPAYPNAADASYFAGKLLDILTAVVSGVGLTVAMAFLVLLS